MHITSELEEKKTATKVARSGNYFPTEQLLSDFSTLLWDSILIATVHVHAINLYAAWQNCYTLQGLTEARHSVRTVNQQNLNENLFCN